MMVGGGGGYGIGGGGWLIHIRVWVEVQGMGIRYYIIVCFFYLCFCLLFSHILSHFLRE